MKKGFLILTILAWTAPSFAQSAVATCNFPKVIGKSEHKGHMDGRGETIGWYEDLVWECESGVRYTAHCDASGCRFTGKPGSPSNRPANQTTPSSPLPSHCEAGQPCAGVAY